MLHNINELGVVIIPLTIFSIQLGIKAFIEFELLLNSIGFKIFNNLEKEKKNGLS